MRQDFAKITHIDPSTAGGALDEMLPLVLRFAAAPSADDLARHDARTIGRAEIVPS